MRHRLIASALVASSLALPPAVALAAEPPASVALSGTARDFRGWDLPAAGELPRGHEDFENANGAERGIMLPDLGPDRRPVYAKGDSGAGSATTHGRALFDQWFHDTPLVNVAEPLTLTLARQSSGRYVFDDQTFFPLDGRGWVALRREAERTTSSGTHNYSFTVELHSELRYTGGELLHVRGDDDIFVFVNGRLALDLGGVHGPENGTIDLAARAGELGLTPGRLHDLDVFVAERHTSLSSLRLDLPRLGFDAGTATVPVASAIEGETLTCSAAGWPDDATLAYAWLRDGAEIAGADGASYATTGADAGRAVACRVTGTRRTAASAVSTAVAVTAVEDPVDPPGPPVDSPRSPPPGPAPLPPPAPPLVAVTEAPGALTRARSARVVFVADPLAAGYECRLDRDAWTPCGSPHTFDGLRAGDHTVAIRAFSADGRRGPEAVRAFQVNPYAPGLTLGSAALRVSSGGSVRLTLGCSPREGEGRGRCEGVARLQRTIRAHGRARTQQLGRARFSAGAGGSAQPQLRLTRAARRALAAAPGRRLTVRVVLDAHDLAGNAARVSFARELRASAPGR